MTQSNSTDRVIEAITSTLNTYAQKARNDDERRMLHRFSTDLANRIRQEDTTFNQGDFLRSSGINPEWGKLAA